MKALTSELFPMLSAPAQTPRLSIPDPMNAPSSRSPNTWGRMNPIAHPTEDHELLCSHSSHRCSISPPWQTPREEPQHSTCVSCRQWMSTQRLMTDPLLPSSFPFFLLISSFPPPPPHLPLALAFLPSVLFCIFKCIGQLQACSPRISASWHSQPCVSPFSLVWAVSRDLLQMTRLCSKGKSLLWLDSQRLWLSPVSTLPGRNSCVLSCLLSCRQFCIMKRSMERPTWQRIKEGFWPTAQ